MCLVVFSSLIVFLASFSLCVDHDTCRFWHCCLAAREAFAESSIASVTAKNVGVEDVLPVSFYSLGACNRTENMAKKGNASLVNDAK